MVRVVSIGSVLSNKDVVARAKRCEAERICFISLKPLGETEAVTKVHEVAGEVRVHSK